MGYERALLTAPARPGRAQEPHAKLAVSTPGDAWEAEADRMAEQALRGAPALPVTSLAPHRVQRKRSACASRSGEGASGQSHGEPLDPGLRAYFEPRFGHDFGDVRVHRDRPAHRLANDYSARAFTLDRSIFFGAGEYRTDTGAGRFLLAHELAHVVQQSSGVGGGQLVQREASPQATDERVPDAPAEETASGDDERAGTERQPLIVDDGDQPTAPGQMAKGRFLDALQVTVCRTSDEVLREVGRSSQGCPHIERWIGHYRRQTAAHLERALLRYAPGARHAATAEDYIPHVAARVRRGVERWARTGELPELPEGMSASDLMPGGGVLGAVASALGGGGLLGGLGRLLFKRRESTSGASGAALQSVALGTGAALEGRSRAKMERAFGRDFARVRVHTAAPAAALSSQLNARAFTVGDDIVFARGEYQPGTLHGDALLAHELAHVVQQHDGPARFGVLGENDAALEDDADRAAIQAVLLSFLSSTAPAPKAPLVALPKLKAGLGLQRCSSPRTTPVTQLESDRMIGQEVGTRLRDFGITADRAQAAEFNVVDDATFVGQYCLSETAAGRACAAEDARGVEGFNDERSTAHGRIYIRRSARDPGTVIHESLHLYQHPNLRARCVSRINEAITEYYTRRIIRRQNLAPRRRYEEMTDGMERLIGIIGEGPIAALYFNGDWDPLRAAINARTNGHFVAWRCAWVQATRLVNNPDDYARLNATLVHFDRSAFGSFCLDPAFTADCQ